MAKKINFNEKMEELKVGLEAINSDEAIKKALDLQGAMLKAGHRYSYRNTLMAMIEAENRGEKISLLGSRAFWFKQSGEHNKRLDAEYKGEGKRKWGFFGVPKGTKGYSCVYPKFFKREDEKTGKEDKVLGGYGYGEMFDISQTGLAGELVALKGLIPEFLGTDSMAGVKSKIVEMIISLGYTVRFEELRQGLSGFLKPSSKEIVINSIDPEDDQVSTLFHELAHGELKHGCSGEHEVVGYEEAEVQAESVAYILASAIGLDTSKYSLKYILQYGKDVNFIMECASKTNTAVNTIMKSLQKVLGIELEEVA